ncbi:MAG: hypothetical protein M1831_000219 [Alyxoria varia]|nr:MAG: hypothetical protein M1831_000219 [Alyxoria varia]
MHHEDYTVRWICALPTETAAAIAMLDEHHEELSRQAHDDNTYSFGRIGKHNVVIACLPAGVTGIASAANVASQLRISFPSIRIGLLVGIGGGVPSEEHDIRLGDVVISKPTGTFGGVIQYDFGKTVQEAKFIRTGQLNRPPDVLLNAVAKLEATHLLHNHELEKYLHEAIKKYPERENDWLYQGTQHDQLFRPGYDHKSSDTTCKSCDIRELESRNNRDQNLPVIHYGLIASANRVMRHGQTRDALSKELGVICFEMEAAGLMDNFPCLVIRGICDYADSHKNKRWQSYAAAVAAAYGKQLLYTIPAEAVMQTTRAAEDQNSIYDLGLNLGDAPEIYEMNFVGREDELEVLHETLLPDPSPANRNVAIISGLGGMGKTQLAIAFAKKTKKSFSTIFWLNAKSEESVKGKEQEEEAVGRFKEWLSHPQNKRWMLIFDNYDDPKTPSRKSVEAYSIKKYFPYRCQGSILVTSRSSKIHFGKPLMLKKLGLEQGLEVLTKRSDRLETRDDPDARGLAARLDGLPLALSTAGDYLRQTPVSFAKYRELHEESWEDLKEVAEELPDYEGRTLYSTWNLSLLQIEEQSPEAVMVLRLLAYFGNNDIWFELLQKGCGGGHNPLLRNNRGRKLNFAFTRRWLRNNVGNHRSPLLEVLSSEVKFNSTMRRLQDYSLVESDRTTGSYTLHSCVHDWTLHYLNKNMSEELFLFALHCVGASFSFETEPFTWLQNNRLLQHALRLRHPRMQEVLEESQHRVSPADFTSMGELYRIDSKLAEAEEMYQRALSGFKKARGLDHTLKLCTICNLGGLYEQQGKLAKAEHMYQRALAGFEQVLGPDHTSTLIVVNNLGLLYTDQGKFAEGEDMYRRALAGFKKVSGLDHTLTIGTLINLGLCWKQQGKLAEAENMCRRALAGTEKVLGPDHTLTFSTVSNLGLLCAQQGKLAEAEDMYQRALAGFEKVLGPDHTLTLKTVSALGTLNKRQGRLAEAEDLYRRGLIGKEKTLGPDHTSTIRTVRNLGTLYERQGKPAEAEVMHQRAQCGME